MLGCDRAYLKFCNGGRFCLLGREVERAPLVRVGCEVPAAVMLTFPVQGRFPAAFFLPYLDATVVSAVTVPLLQL